MRFGGNMQEVKDLRLRCAVTTMPSIKRATTLSAGSTARAAVADAYSRMRQTGMVLDGGVRERQASTPLEIISGATRAGVAFDAQNRGQLTRGPNTQGSGRGVLSLIAGPYRSR